MPAMVDTPEGDHGLPTVNSACSARVAGSAGPSVGSDKQDFEALGSNPGAPPDPEPQADFPAASQRSRRKTQAHSSVSANPLPTEHTGLNPAACGTRPEVARTGADPHPPSPPRIKAVGGDTAPLDNGAAAGSAPGDVAARAVPDSDSGANAGGWTTTQAALNRGRRLRGSGSGADADVALRAQATPDRGHKQQAGAVAAVEHAGPGDGGASASEQACGGQCGDAKGSAGGVPADSAQDNAVIGTGSKCRAPSDAGPRKRARRKTHVGGPEETDSMADAPAEGELGSSPTGTAQQGGSRGISHPASESASMGEAAEPGARTRARRKTTATVLPSVDETAACVDDGGGLCAAGGAAEGEEGLGGRGGSRGGAAEGGERPGGRRGSGRKKGARVQRAEAGSAPTQDENSAAAANSSASTAVGPPQGCAPLTLSFLNWFLWGGRLYTHTALQRLLLSQNMCLLIGRR
jgi:hypothetical protein